MEIGETQGMSLSLKPKCTSHSVLCRYVSLKSTPHHNPLRTVRPRLALSELRERHQQQHHLVIPHTIQLPTPNLARTLVVAVTGPVNATRPVAQLETFQFILKVPLSEVEKQPLL